MFNRSFHYFRYFNCKFLAALFMTLPCLAYAQMPAPTLAAKSYLLLDASANQVLASEAADTQMDPASLTKVMTAYLTFQALKNGSIRLTEAVNISENAWRTGGSRMFVEPQRPVTVDELLHGMMIQSGNDATVALAEKIAGTEANFVTLMNREAQRMELKNTQFRNASGLSEAGHYSSARDLSTLALRLIADFPESLRYYVQREYRYNNITQANRNRLLWLDPTVDGLKTGHTEAAGYCLIATAKREQRRLISVVLGTTSDNARAQESQKLLNYGFQNFEAVRVLQANVSADTIPVFKGSASQLKAGVREDLWVSVPRGQTTQLKATLLRNERLLAPLRVGQPVGTVKLSLAGKPWRDVPLVALEDVKEAGVFGRAIDTIRLWFK